ncbi:MAG: SCP2 sterol-binding domain-containing protein [Deltaproteobacteria bacterium]|nr:SCP2 sterol-binding domain-containing protein [Deltaproteobacteria bacterium]
MTRSCKEFFDKMPESFQKDVAAKISCLYQFDLGGEGGGKWFVEVRNGELAMGEGEKPNPDVTLVAKAQDYIDIAEGRKSPMLAMATGAFKIKGNMGLAMKLEKIFKRK